MGTQKKNSKIMLAKSLVFQHHIKVRLPCLHEYLISVSLQSVSFGIKICQMNYQAQTSKTFRPGKMTFKHHRHILMCSLRDNRVVSMATAIHREQTVISETAEAS